MSQEKQYSDKLIENLCNMASESLENENSSGLNSAMAIFGDGSKNAQALLEHSPRSGGSAFMSEYSRHTPHDISLEDPSAKRMRHTSADSSDSVNEEVSMMTGVGLIAMRQQSVQRPGVYRVHHMQQEMEKVSGLPPLNRVANESTPSFQETMVNKIKCELSSSVTEHQQRTISLSRPSSIAQEAHALQGAVQSAPSSGFLPVASGTQGSLTGMVRMGEATPSRQRGQDQPPTPPAYFSTPLRAAPPASQHHEIIVVSGPGRDGRVPASSAAGQIANPLPNYASPTKFTTEKGHEISFSAVMRDVMGHERTVQTSAGENALRKVGGQGGLQGALNVVDMGILKSPVKNFVTTPAPILIAPRPVCPVIPQQTGGGTGTSLTSSANAMTTNAAMNSQSSTVQTATVSLALSDGVPTTVGQVRQTSGHVITNIGMPGIVSPTGFLTLAASPLNTPRHTPRSTPVPGGHHRLLSEEEYTALVQSMISTGAAPLNSSANSSGGGSLTAEDHHPLLREVSNTFLNYLNSDSQGAPPSSSQMAAAIASQQAAVAAAAAAPTTFPHPLGFQEIPMRTSAASVAAANDAVTSVVAAVAASRRESFTQVDSSTGKDQKKQEDLPDSTTSEAPSGGGSGGQSETTSNN